MPGKSHGRHQSRRERKKARQVQGTTAPVQRPSVVQPVMTHPPHPETVTARVKEPQSLPRIQYPYIGAELKLIGILAALMFALLVVLALIFT